MSQKFVNGDNLKRAVDYIKDGTIVVGKATADSDGNSINSTYAKTSDIENGSIVASKALVAKNLEPVNSASGSTQTAPFINQGTATANNDSQASVDTGTLGQHLEKQANTVVVNQYIPATKATETKDGITITNNNDGTFTLNGLASADVEFPLGFVSKFSGTGHDILWGFLTPSITGVTLKDAWKWYKTGSSEVTTNRPYNNVDYRIGIANGTNITSKIVLPVAIDLTQWFNGNDNIPADLLANPNNFRNYYQGSLAYNTGQLVNSNGRYLVNGGQNVWDEVAEIGSIDGTTGQNDNNVSNLLRSKNYIQAIPNREYYALLSSYNARIFYYDKDKNFISYYDRSGNGTFTTPSNCIYIRFRLNAAYGTTYNHDITISLYYEGEDYSTYVPYEAPKVYDTGNEELLSAGSIKDIKTPDGTITRYVGSVDLEVLNWSYDSGNQIKYALIDDIKSPASGNELGNITSSKYINVSRNALTNVGEIALSTNKYINIKVNSVSDTPTGILQYESATPTTEQGTSFSENMDINDMGNMAWYSAYTDENTNTPVSVPQGCKIFYPAWYAGFIDTLGQREDIDWTAEQVVSQAQLTVVDTKADSIFAIMKENVGGALRHQLVAKTSGLDFHNTDYVDIGTFQWTLVPTYAHYFQTNSIYSDIKSSTSNAICTMFKTNNVSYDSMQDGDMRINGQYIIIRLDSYSDTTTFKAAMKGVLLAYEKTSE